jgi:hypothetical protein
MMHCAELAGIHEEICHMPMAYYSLIGDMESIRISGYRDGLLKRR